MNLLTVLSLCALASVSLATSYPPPGYKKAGDFNQNSCSNFFRCCPYWAKQGKCTRRSSRNYMRANCKASCGVCRPNYLNGYGCHDYFTGCNYWKNHQGMCKNDQYYWMGENCRATCGWCHVARDVDQCPYDRRPKFRQEPVVAASQGGEAPISYSPGSLDGASDLKVGGTGPTSDPSGNR